jgi:hypothetical protein
MVEGTRRQAAAERFAGIAYVRPRDVSIAACIDSLELIAKAQEPEETQETQYTIYHLPL